MRCNKIVVHLETKLDFTVLNYTAAFSEHMDWYFNESRPYKKERTEQSLEKLWRHYKLLSSCGIVLGKTKERKMVEGRRVLRLRWNSLTPVELPSLAGCWVRTTAALIRWHLKRRIDRRGWKTSHNPTPSAATLNVLIRIIDLIA